MALPGLLVYSCLPRSAPDLSRFPAGHADIGFVPELEAEQRPEPVLVISTPALVLLNQLRHRLRRKEAMRAQPVRAEQLMQHGAQVVAQPAIDRHVKAM